ncbi:MAG: phosphoribosylanthranilate isomerase [Lachnospiraceae bacterium]|nr:phosphoribosylanthranilate isomerase [Lachnospiraceae bacterium]
MTKIKICGLMRTEDAGYINEAKPAMAGMILTEGFRRSISIDHALAVRRCIDPSIPTVGVFVDDEIKKIVRIVKNGIISIVQLHGNEDEKYIGEVKRKTGVKVIKAFKIESEDDVRKACESKADIILLDSGTGTGKSFDWSLLKDVKREYILAGGLKTDNVRRAVENLHPWAVDVSSGVEVGGVKNREKILKFVSEVNGDYYE